MISQSIKQTAFNCPTDLMRQKLAAGNKHHDAAIIKKLISDPKLSQWIPKNTRG